MATTSQTMTAKQLAALPDRGKRYELVDGELQMMSPAGHDHGRVAMRIGSLLEQQVHANGLGAVYAAETGFLISTNPDTVRAPDVAFVRQERLDATGPVEGYWPGAPDLCVEVVSPHDSFTDVEDKSLAWLAAGTRVVWIVDPKQKRVTVYRSRNDITVLEVDSKLEFPGLLPGWSIQVAEIFG